MKYHSILHRLVCVMIRSLCNLSIVIFHFGSRAEIRSLLRKFLIIAYLFTSLYYTYEPRYEKTNVLVSDLVRHKPGCKATEDGWRLEISDLESRGIVLSV